MLVVDKLNLINTKYIKICDVEVLKKYYDELTKNITSQGISGLIDENLKADAYALSYRLGLKILSIDYFETFKESYYNDLINFIDEVIKRSKDYPNTLIIANNLLNISNKVYNIIKDINHLLDKVIKDNVVTTNNEDDLIKVKNELLKINSDFNITNPFINIEYININDNINNYLKKNIDLVDESIIKLSKELENNLIKKYLIPLDKTYLKYEYYQGEVIKNNTDYYNYVIYTPFKDELDLFLTHYEKTINLVNYLDLNQIKKEDLKDLFNVIIKRRLSFCYLNLDLINDNNSLDIIYNSLNELALNKVISYIYSSTSNRNIYDNFSDYINKNNLNNSLSYAYLSMPNYENFCQILNSNNLENEKIKDLAFCGFIGLNRILIDASIGENWFNNALILSKKRTEAAKSFLENIAFQDLLIDSKWGDFKKNSFDIFDDNPNYDDFDYDKLHDLNPKNIKKIFNSNINIFEKCHLAVSYALLHRDDKSTWSLISKEEKFERVIDATYLVYQLLNLKFLPKVEFKEIVDNSPTTLGCCYDGGKRIVYKNKYVEEDVLGIFGTICHESYHALQHLLKDNLQNNRFNSWYFHNLGITEGQVKEYIEIDKYYTTSDFNLYYSHATEWGARAFANDCLKAIDRSNNIDFE